MTRVALSYKEEFYFFISVVLREFKNPLCKNLHVFNSFKVLHVSNFTVIKEGNAPYLQK